MAKNNFYQAIQKTPKNKRTNEREITDVLNHTRTSIIPLKGFYININTQEDKEDYEDYLER